MNITIKKQPPQLLFKKCILRNLTKFQEKNCVRISFFQRRETCNFIKKDPLTQVLSCKFCETFKSTSFKEQLRATDSDNAPHN